MANVIGMPTSEAIALGNMGDALRQLDRKEEAEQAFQQAIALCKESKHPAAFAFQGSLAVIIAEKGLHTQALAMIDESVKALKPYPMEYGKLLSKKGMVQLYTEPQAADKTLQQVLELAADLESSKDSELVKSIEHLRKAIRQTAAQRESHSTEV